ncbi:hypothetical protein ANCDUO_17408 [Ancylostoma duodenale]|uniref:Uncharacterized protein n=1 Tax=Ancylostoma duodenale TaxID=51022 RepID=A0A0C2G5Z1_9BILA|nr:hypothetical protein ANCDUO_17408 [Ancylostoma duodenale]
MLTIVDVLGSDEQLHLIYSSSYVQGSPSVKKYSQVVPKVVVLPNKAQLPTGIAAVRPHLEQVDNVPLLVSLITDCTSPANLEMLEIMQEYGELVLAIGSSLSVANTNIFLQVFLTVFVQLPCLTLGSIFTPFHPKTNLVGNATVACSFADVVCSVASDHLSDVPLSTTSIRHIIGFHVLFSYASGVDLHRVLSIFSISGIVVWMFFILIVNELVKLRSIRAFAREQRRTKLGFDTKLGMNSPY